jgi:hypothetical protein
MNHKTEEITKVGTKPTVLIKIPPAKYKLVRTKALRPKLKVTM